MYSRNFIVDASEKVLNALVGVVKMRLEILHALEVVVDALEVLVETRLDILADVVLVACETDSGDVLAEEGPDGSRGGRHCVCVCVYYANLL
jgi:hypothetical protein